MLRVTRGISFGAPSSEPGPPDQVSDEGRTRYLSMLAQAEEKLGKFGLMRPVFVEGRELTALSESDKRVFGNRVSEAIGYVVHLGTLRICVGRYDRTTRTLTWTPVGDCSDEQMAVAASWYPALLDSAKSIADPRF